MKTLKAWIPCIVLILLLFVLIAATRIYVSPADLLFVWKGGLSFNDTVVNLDDYTDSPTMADIADVRKGLALKNPELLAQMEDMGLLTEEACLLRKKQRARKAGIKDSSATTTKYKTAEPGKTESAAKAEPGKTGPAKDAKDKTARKAN